MDYWQLSSIERYNVTVHRLAPDYYPSVVTAARESVATVGYWLVTERASLRCERCPAIKFQ